MAWTRRAKSGSTVVLSRHGSRTGDRPERLGPPIATQTGLTCHLTIVRGPDLGLNEATSAVEENQ
jgi:hypothetical protein